jgi:hypothetical protein
VWFTSLLSSPLKPLDRARLFCHNKTVFAKDSPLGNQLTRNITRLAHVVLLVVAAVALTYPYLTQGLVPGHDRLEHVEYQYYFNKQMAAGESYPRWLPGMNRGHGSPAFFIFYPLPYYVARGLDHIVPNHWGAYAETRAQGLGVVLATILAALFAYLWCGTFVDRHSAVTASLAFITLPYFFAVDLYLRVSVGELWALALMPLAFYFVERRSAAPRQSLAGLAAVFGLVLLSHLFTAALLTPVVLVYAVWRSASAERLLAALETAAALALGVALAAVYTLPFFSHRHFMHPENMFAIFGSNYSPLSQMFAYDSSMFPRDTPGWNDLGVLARGLAAAGAAWIGYTGYRRWREGSLRLTALGVAVLSIVALILTLFSGHLPGLGEIPGAAPLSPYFAVQRAHIFLASFLTLEAVLFCYWSLRKTEAGGIADFLLGMALASYFMMTRWSRIFWIALHFLWSIQFPWRFNVFLLLAAVGLGGLAVAELRKQPLRESFSRYAAIIFMWALVAGGIAYTGGVQDAFWKTTPIAYEPKSLETILPVYAQVKTRQEALDSANSSKDATLDVAVIAGQGRSTADLPTARRIDLNAACESGCTIQIGQFYYPAWRARIAKTGAPIPLRAGVPGGLMQLSLPPGNHSVVVELPLDWSEKAGPWVSLASLFLVAFLALSDRFQRSAATSPQFPSDALASS